jgi:hypothetical protein
MMAFNIFTLILRNGAKPKAQIVKHQQESQISPLPNQPIEQQRKIPDLVLKVNERNATIKSFSSDDVKIKLWEKGMRYRLSGFIHYEKPRNFRMKIDSILGPEVDLGSNQKIFWFWSKRMKPPALHYADHDKFTSTRLKTPFNPRAMMDSLGFNQINTGPEVTFSEDPKYVIVKEPRLSGSGLQIFKYTFINKTTGMIDGLSVADADGSISGTTEIKSYNGLIPTELLYHWADTGNTMLLEIHNAKLNVPIDAANWVMPDMREKIDMNKDILF